MVDPPVQLALQFGDGFRSRRPERPDLVLGGTPAVESLDHETEQRRRPVLVMTVEPLQVHHAHRLVDQILPKDIEQAGLADFAQPRDQDVLVPLESASNGVEHCVAAEEKPMVGQSVLGVEKVVARAVGSLELAQIAPGTVVGQRCAQCAHRNRDNGCAAQP
jgi:hypothetical protein